MKAHEIGKSKLAVRRSAERGHTQLSWLDSWHTFSFDSYYDPQHMAFGPLRVINEDRIAPGGGFGTHPHRDMEIITYVVEGKLQHRDSLGNGSTILPGEIQKMSAGSGILHSEFNASDKSPVHLLQIWIMPETRGLEPRYEQEKFELKPGVWQLLGGPNGQGLISIQQKVKLYALNLIPGGRAEFKPSENANLWIQTIKGSIQVQDKALVAGDGLAVSSDQKLDFYNSDNQSGSELLLFELLGS